MAGVKAKAKAKAKPEPRNVLAENAHAQDAKEVPVEAPAPLSRQQPVNWTLADPVPRLLARSRKKCSPRKKRKDLASGAASEHAQGTISKQLSKQPSSTENVKRNKPSLTQPAKQP